MSVSSNLLFACAVCFGDPNSLLTQGANAGILLLLGVIGFVLGSIVAVMALWIRRARMLESRVVPTSG